MEKKFYSKMEELYLSRLGNENIVRLDKLSKKYNKVCALNEVSLSLPKAGIVGLIGKNGSGKTTMIKLIAGLIKATFGELKVFEMNPFDNIKVKKRLVYLYHNYTYPDKLSLNDIFKLYTYSYENFDKHFANNLLEHFNLNCNMRYNDLSKGMASVFNFICAISCRTEIVLLDEPVLGMDVTVRKDVYEILQKEYEEHPRLFIISSHLISELEDVVTDVVVIDNGKLKLIFNIDDFRENVYKVCGDNERIDAFCVNREILYIKQEKINNYAIISESITDEIDRKIQRAGLSAKAARLEDIFITLNDLEKDKQIEKLWDKSDN